MKPNKENIQIWVDALRSGEYAQTFGTLAKDDGFCCLGVACEVSGVKSRYDEHEEVFLFGGEDEEAVLPAEVREWLGIARRNPVIRGTSLAEWNDRCEESFADIADMIEEEFLT